MHAARARHKNNYRIENKLQKESLVKCLRLDHIEGSLDSNPAPAPNYFSASKLRSLAIYHINFFCKPDDKRIRIPKQLESKLILGAKK